MGKEQNKKPNFLRDINADIFKGMTAGGKTNIVGLVGELKEAAQEVTDICGLRFNGYLAKLETIRPRGTADEVTVAFTDEAISKLDGDIAGFEIAAGSRLLICGKIQTLKDFASGKVLVFVLADFVALSPKAMPQNDIALIGELAYTPTHRTTPRGKHISDIRVKVQNVLTAGACYIPCVCWQEQADAVAGWRQGDKVRLLGRYQSREYSKLLDSETGERETRTAYELSVCYIERENEKEGGDV